MVVLLEDQVEKIRSILERIIDGENFRMSEVEECLADLMEPSNTLACPFERGLSRIIAGEIIRSLKGIGQS